MNNTDQPHDLTRRDFLRGGSLAGLMSLLGGVELRRPAAAAEAETPGYAGPKVRCAVIGLGFWGREIVSNLTRIPSAELAAICDTYPAYLRRTARGAPDAAQVADYRQILDDPSITAVVVSTPTHLHKDIVLQALQAGKHVYCEAPLANTVEDARTIAKAALAAPKLHFQPGLQLRGDKQRQFVLDFIRSGASGKPVFSRAQWLKKQSWRQVSPNPEREREMNWRLERDTSLGLIGELGIHQIDLASWIYNAIPLAVSGGGDIIHWSDGRDVPDTTQVDVLYPGGLHLVHLATLASSYEREYEVFHGTDGTVVFRGSKAWLFKESDAPAIGWEVYARKDAFYEETGIALMMDASKQKAHTEKPDPADVKTPLYFALEAFLRSAADVKAATEDFIETFGDDAEALLEHLASVSRQPAASVMDGYTATVVAIKANEAVLANSRIELDPQLFELG